MYRLVYSNLNKKQVEDILAKRTPPVCASNFCTRLSGKTLKLVLDKQPVEGPALEYEFKSDTKLLVRENGAAAVECDYGALTLKEITLFSHMIPGTKKGYNVIINWETTVVTVFEMWFIDYEGLNLDTTKIFYPMAEAYKIDAVVNREVQRQCYFGYFESPGSAPPVKRDKLSLRLENRMIEWKEDRKKHRLTTYTSTTYSTMVELDTPDGGDVLTFVSDILQVSDSVYIYCFGEVEYSGRLSVEVIDIFNPKVKKIGVTMGIDENDQFEYNLYKGKGTLLGRYASFFDFNDRGDQYAENIRNRIDYTVKGARATYRPSIMAKQLSMAEIEEAAKEPSIFDTERAKERMMASSNVPDTTDYCAGKKLKFRGDDGFSVELDFLSGTELKYRVDGEGGWNTETYRAVEMDEDFIALAFYRSGSFPPAHLVFGIDFINGCATCISSKMGSKHDLHDPEPSYHFGAIHMEGLTPLRIFRHGFTDELLGRAFTQTYSDAGSSTHIYNAPRSYSWTTMNNATPGSPGNRTGGYVWSSPCEYIKLRDDLYVMSWVEQKWSGHMDTLFRNMRTGRDCGFAYGISGDGKVIHLDMMGSISRSAGYIDLSGIYSLKNFDPKA